MSQENIRNKSIPSKEKIHFEDNGSNISTSTHVQNDGKTSPVSDREANPDENLNETLREEVSQEEDKSDFTSSTDKGNDCERNGHNLIANEEETEMQEKIIMKNECISAQRDHDEDLQDIHTCIDKQSDVKPYNLNPTREERKKFLRNECLSSKDNDEDKELGDVRIPIDRQTKENNKNLNSTGKEGETMDESLAPHSESSGQGSHSKDDMPRDWYSQSVLAQDEDNPHVLDPENPLMIKFQNALRDLLQKQLNKLNEEVSVMKSNFKSKAKEREDLGVNLFNIQEEVNRSQKQLTILNKKLLELEEMRFSLEKRLKDTQAIHKAEAKKISDNKEKEENLRLEIEYLKNYEGQLKQWESDYNSELAVSQRIADKTEKQKEDMSKAKQKQDILLLRLRKAVLELESKREQLRAQREVKLQQQDSLRRTIAEGSADLEALQSEQIRLTRIWNGVVVNLQQRDRVYNSVQMDLQKAKEAFQLMLSEIESYRRAAKLEMIQSEKTINILDRLESEYNDLMKTFSRSKESVSELEAEYSYFSGMVKQTEDSLQSALMDGKVLSQQSNYHQRELERYTQKKISLEMQILENLQNQSKHDKALQHHVRTIKTLKEKNKTEEMSFIMMENQIAKTMVETERTRGAVLSNENLLREATEEAEKYAKDLSLLDASLKQHMATMQNKMLVNDQLTKKLDGIIARSGIKDESPQEVQIKAIEVEIDDATQEAEKKQAFWLRLQSHIVRLTEERQKQLQELNLLYKQVHILNQRVLKIEHETEKHKKGQKDVEQQINDLDLSLNKLTIELHNKRGYKETLDKENALLQSESICLFKDMERENFEQEEDLNSLEQNNLLLNQDILDLKRECLAWEKKILLAVETKQMNEEDNKATGELSQMKVEIHRMDVRFSQLRKVQDTLVKDLEHCIMRRESLLEEADAREKRSVGNCGSVSNRIVFQRKLENLSNRTKQAKMESKNIASQLEKELPNELSQIRVALEEAEKTMQSAQQKVAEGRKRIDDAFLLKQEKLDMLVRLQRKVRLYTKVKEGKHRLLFRTESALEAEMCKQRSISNDLLELIPVLQQHFPPLQQQISHLNKILQASSIRSKV